MTRLWQHQEAAIRWMLDRLYGILDHGMGSGKTRTTLEYLRRLGPISRVLVCCPKAVIAAWEKQVGLWFPEIRFLAVAQSTRPQKEKALTAALADLSPLIVCCNYDSAWRLDALERTRWDVLVWDEIHRLKAPNGRASRWAARVCTKNPKARKVGLTGTLIPHSILDVQPIYRAVESPDCPTFGTSIVRHRSRYAVENPHQRGMVIAWRNLDEAHQKINATTHRVKSSDVLDLPPIQFLDVPVELTPDEAALYREIETDFVAVVADGTVTASNALVKLLRLQQICGGSVRFDETPAARQIAEHPAKGAALADMLEDLHQSEPLVVFCRFTSDISLARKVCEASGRTVSELSGRVNELADWQAGKTTVLIAQIQSGGIGIDLTRASYCVFVSLGYSLAEYEQAVARLHRPGQANHTRIYHLIATIRGRSTVDGRVYEALRERKEVVNAILDGYRAAPVGAR